MDPDHRTLQGGLVHQYAAAGFIENRKGDSTTSKTLEYAAGDFGDFGDAQNELSSKWAPVVKQAYERCPDAVGSVNACDLVNTSGNDSEWRDWFGAMDGYSQATNLIAAPGNHEYAGDTYRKKWKATFEYPDNGPRAIPAHDDTPAERQRAAYEAHMAEALAETAYHTDYQGVRFLSLNAGTGDARQLMTRPTSRRAARAAPIPPGSGWTCRAAGWTRPSRTTRQVGGGGLPPAGLLRRRGPRREGGARRLAPRVPKQRHRPGADGPRPRVRPRVRRRGRHRHTRRDDGTRLHGGRLGPEYYELAPEDDDVGTRNGATQVVRSGHTSTFQGVRVTKDQLHYEAVVAAKWDDRSTTGKEVGEVLDSFTVTKYDDGTTYVTEEGTPVPPAPAAGR
ncbi:hypothetical protein ACR6C2_02790 [Streptomyces sp. INA 01156]